MRQLLLPMGFLQFSALWACVSSTDATNQAIDEFELGRHCQYILRDNDCALDHYLSAWHHLDILGSNDASFLSQVPGMMNDIGVLLMGIGNLSRAIDAFSYALKLDPTFSSALSNLGGVFIDIGRSGEALALYKRATESAPNRAELFHNTAYCYHSLGDNVMAMEYWRKALIIDPHLHQTRTDLATTLCTDGAMLQSQLQFEKALSSLIKKCPISSSCFSSYWLILFQKKLGIVPVIQESTLQRNMKVRDDFIEATSNIIDFFPVDSIIHPLTSIGCSSLGYYLLYQGFDNLLPRQALANAYWHVSSSYLRYTAPFLLPQVSAARLLMLNSLGNSSVPSETFSQDLNYKYSGTEVNKRKIKVGFLSSFFYRHSVGLLLGGVIKQLSRTDFDVFVITIDGGQFSGGDHITKSIRGSGVVKHVHWNTNIYDISSEIMRAKISNLLLDVLIFGEIGMDSATYFLAFSRFAHRSIVFWGHAVTSGISDNNRPPVRLRSNIANASRMNSAWAGGPDYFVSSVLFEDTRNGGRRCAQLRYVERLVLMEGMTTFFERPVEPLSVCDILPHLNLDCSAERRDQCKNKKNDVSPSCCPDEVLWKRLEVLRNHKISVFHAMLCASNESSTSSQFCQQSKSHLDLDPDNSIRLYGLPQTIYKLSPSFDNIILKILLRDQAGYVVIPLPRIKSWSELLITRLRRFLWIKMPAIDADTVFRRIIFIRSLNESEYITLCSIFDVILDPFPVGGGRSSLEIFSTGNIVVLQENVTSVLHLTSGMYRAMGFNAMSCCLAADEDQYVEKSYSIATNTSFQLELRSDLFRRKNALFENRSVIAEWERLLHNVVNSPRPQYGLCRTLEGGFTTPISEEYCSDLAPENARHLGKFHINYGCEPILLGQNFEDFTSNETAKTDCNKKDSNFHLQQETSNCSGCSELEGNLIYMKTFSAVNTYDRFSHAGLNHEFHGGAIGAHHCSCKRRSFQEDIRIEVFEGADWRKVCSDATSEVLDRLQRMYICSSVGRNVERLNQPELHRLRVRFTQSTKDIHSLRAIHKVLANISIREGDERDDAYWSNIRFNGIADEDGSWWIRTLTEHILLPLYLPHEIEGSLFSILSREKATNSWLNYIIVNHSDESTCCAAQKQLSGTQVLSAACCPRYAPLIPSTTKLFDRAKEESEKSSDHNRGRDDSRVTVGMTTCKRLHLFLRTMSLLLNHIGDFPNKFVKEVIVIDDNSFAEDRNSMINNFPMVRYIFKNSTEKGHANSLNILLNVVSTRFFVYIEDDWELSTFSLSLGLQSYFKWKQNTDWNAELFQFGSEQSETFYKLLWESARLLSRNKHIFQVLFNAQWDRNCSLGLETLCNSSLLSLGGWSSTESLQHDFPFSMHEFGITPRHPSSAESVFKTRRHDFSYWPGFSLNPGIWDLEKIKNILESWHANKAMTGSSAVWGNYFSELDPAFEQHFSIVAHLCNMHVAYLHAIMFRHIGTEVSAYKLQGFDRPWEQ